MRPITILVCALGGEGGGVLSEWLFETAMHAGHSAQATSIPGVAQRTGATTYYLEVFPQPDADLGGRRPVFSLNPVPGAIDLLVSSELLETVRQIGLGMASPDRTLVVGSTSRALTVAEKMQMGDGRLSDAALVAAVQRHARSAVLLDLATLAREAGTVISAVLLGAIAASGVLPFARDAYEETIRRSGKGVEASLRGFAAAFDAVTAQRAQQAQQAQQAQAEALARSAAASSAPIVPALPPDVAARLPAPLHERVALGYARLVDYQDEAYARRYVERLERVLAAERRHDPQAVATTLETARWLALWMAFDDVVRVAALKLRAARMARIRREVDARDDEIVKVYDHFKPGVPEFAGLLPKAWAARLAAWDARRKAAGREPWTLPLRIGTHTVTGALALRLVASLKGWRRRGSRFALEQSLIERWLAAVEAGAAEHPALGLEVAQCGRLVKGYGSTNERGKVNLLHVVDQLAPPAGDAARAGGQDAVRRAEAIRAVRTAALADDAGRALDQALVAHGAAPRPAREQPVRWYRRRPDLPVAGAAQRP